MDVGKLSLFTFCWFTSLLIAITAQNSDYKLFLKFVNTYKKTYLHDTAEFEHRYQIFKTNLELYKKLNQADENGTAVYGINKFSDLSQDEFRKYYLQDLLPMESYITLPANPITPSWRLKQHKDKVDWREKNIISAVKDQGACGACWAFSVTETTESMYALKANTTVPNLSVQEVIDCAKGNYGCEGGDTCKALQWMSGNSTTIEYNSEYPLTDKTQACQLANATLPGVKVTDFTCKGYISNEDKMLELLSTVGPLAVTVDASTWNNYQGGIIKFHCSAYNNHAVQIVGYDLTGDVPFYIVRNSWGPDFGDKGYLYIKVGENLCGLAVRVSTITVAT